MENNQNQTSSWKIKCYWIATGSFLSRYLKETKKGGGLVLFVLLITNLRGACFYGDSLLITEHTPTHLNATDKMDSSKNALLLF